MFDIFTLFHMLSVQKIALQAYISYSFFNRYSLQKIIKKNNKLIDWLRPLFLSHLHDVGKQKY